MRASARNFRTSAAVLGLTVCLLGPVRALPGSLDVPDRPEHAQTEEKPGAREAGGFVLSPDQDFKRRIEGGEHHIYVFDLAVGHAFHVIVTQFEIDLALGLLDPRGRNRLTVDGPNGPDGPETLAVIAAEGGRYRLEVVAGPGSAGSYRLEIRALGPAQEQDRQRAGAMDLYARAERHRRQRTAASRSAAREEYLRARDGFRRAEEPLLVARTERRLGQLLLDLGDVDQALLHLEQALVLYRGRSNGWEQGPLYNDAGKAWRLAGEPDRARELFERAIAVSQRHGHHPPIAVAWNNLGVLYASLGEMQKALNAYSQALDEWRLLGNRTERATVLHNLGVHYVSLGRLEEGLDFLHQALELHYGRKDPGRQAMTLTAIGWAQGLRRELEPALMTYDRAVELRRAAGDEMGEAVTLDQRGTIYLRMGRYEDALESYRRALRRVGNNPLNEAYTRLNIGAAHLEAGRAEMAIEHLETALRSFRKMKVLGGEAAALVQVARAQRDLGRLRIAQERLNAAIEIVESVRTRLQSRWLRSSFLAVRHDVYSTYIDVLMRLYAREPHVRHAERAFEVSERARARTLLESLVEARTGLRAAAPPVLLEEERALRIQINAKESRRVELAAEGERNQAVAYERQLRRLLLEYETLEGRIRAVSRFFDEPQTLSLEQIQREILDPETLLLTYSLGDEASYLWVLGSDSFASYSLAPRQEIEDLARQVHRLLPRSHLPGFRNRATMLGADLSRAVLGSAAGKMGRKRLLILSDGALHYIPFGALPQPWTDDGSGRPRPLLVDHEIVYLPSASVLAQLRQNRIGRVPPDGLLAVVADPVFGLGDPRLEARPRGPASTPETAPHGATELDRAARDFGDLFERLPFAGAEADAILAMAGNARSFHATGFEATRELMLSGRLEPYRVVHLATHGLLNGTHPALSGLVFSLIDENGHALDGFLRLNEIFELHLAADLVVLSACRTALGKEVRGEGLLGLAHGFFYAGASRLVASFWNINDRSTAELMKRFYRGMFHDGLPAVSALRAAQLSMLDEDEWSAPYHWAGFALAGEWR